MAERVDLGIHRTFQVRRGSTKRCLNKFKKRILCRTNQIITPFEKEEVERKKITLHEFHPIHKLHSIWLITVYDTWALLWSHAFRPSRKITLKEQVNYLMRSLELLVESLMTIQLNEKLRPLTV